MKKAEPVHPPVAHPEPEEPPIFAEARPIKSHGKVEDDPRYKSLLAFAWWVRDWAKFNDLEVRNRANRLLAEIGESDRPPS